MSTHYRTIIPGVHDALHAGAAMAHPQAHPILAVAPNPGCQAPPPTVRPEETQ